MNLETFERRALALWGSIPAGFREGVTAFVVEPGTFHMGRADDDQALGLCEPDAAFAALPDAGVYSIIRIFYGTFVDCAASDEDFDWEGELWETIRHELQHHLEWRAGVDHLGDEDEVEVQNQRRIEGNDFTPWFHRGGAQLDRHAWLADGDLFLELSLKRGAWWALAETGASVSWGALTAKVEPVPRAELEAADLWYADADWEIAGDDEAGVPWRDVVIVLARVRGWFG